MPHDTSPWLPHSTAVSVAVTASIPPSATPWTAASQRSPPPSHLPLLREPLGDPRIGQGCGADSHQGSSRCEILIHVLEKPNGHFVVTVNKLGEPTVEDYVIEIDRVTGDIIREWDLRQSLEYGRRAWPSGFADLDVDWFHGNGLAYDPVV